MSLTVLPTLIWCTYDIYTYDCFEYLLDDAILQSLYPK